ncbi:MAG: MmcQ/YjbR family DNA-binding protein [Bacteroidales bacterium]|nr:MmcQ/YjbR family DNA-binding protein [Bacteroidales bacterium]
MNIEGFRNYCLSKKGTTEGFPFDETTLVFKVIKMFALTDIEGEFRVNLKCDPERTIKLREEYPEHIIPGYHMNKKHWNTIIVEGSVPEKLIYELIDHSYDLIFNSLTKKQKEELGNL